eukprot:TRINITY_DN19032_c0_g1_i2.p1 TRINITY_DN19032_c0_g1~~TRINITY_DN19032_c0_g1_i2.p1  ORF type:complete len:294 (+),score=29.28 TRINITY_DN19032_c0_g1_i2:67-882(+)
MAHGFPVRRRRELHCVLLPLRQAEGGLAPRAVTAIAGSLAELQAELRRAVPQVEFSELLYFDDGVKAWVLLEDITRLPNCPQLKLVPGGGCSVGLCAMSSPSSECGLRRATSSPQRPPPLPWQQQYIHSGAGQQLLQPPPAPKLAQSTPRPPPPPPCTRRTAPRAELARPVVAEDMWTVIFGAVTADDAVSCRWGLHCGGVDAPLGSLFQEGFAVTETYSASSFCLRLAPGVLRPGRYEVTLRVTNDNDGQVSVATQDLRVPPDPLSPRLL